MSIQQFVRPNIQRLQPYSSARSEFKGQADVFLDANENPFDTGLNRYPDPLQKELKAVISKNKGISAKHIFLGNGSDEVIDLLIRIFCEPRVDRIITLPPTYGMYKVSAGIADVAVQEVPLTTDFQPDPEAILQAADARSKILFLCSPNNPTGNDFNPALVQRLIQDFPGIVVVDEAYIDFSQQPSFAQAIEQHPNLVVMQTFSKAWGLAGIRLGMAFAGTEVIELLNKVKPPYNVNQLTQKAALEALQRSDEQEQMVATLLDERRKLEAALPELPFVERVFPSQANFLLVRVDDPQALYRYLVDQKIIVRDRSNVHLCAGALRITVGTPDENQRLLETLRVYTATARP